MGDDELPALCSELFWLETKANFAAHFDCQSLTTILKQHLGLVASSGKENVYNITHNVRVVIDVG